MKQMANTRETEGEGKYDAGEHPYTNKTGMRILTRDARPRKRKTTPRWGITEGDAEQISQGQREAKDTGEKTNKVHRTRKPKDEVLNAEKSKDAEVKQHRDYRPPEDYDAHNRIWRKGT